MSQQILRLPTVKKITGLSRSSIYLRISENKFPRPIHLGGQAVGWLESEINVWFDEQIQKRTMTTRGTHEAILGSI